MVTYQAAPNRTEYAVRTVRSTIEHLQYPKHLVSWYIADDGSPKDHMVAILDALHGQQLLGYHSERIRRSGDENTYFCGVGWNRGYGIGHQNSDYVLFLEDDWEMEADLDPTPHIKLLDEREDVGMITYRILSVDAGLYTVGHDDTVYLMYLRGHQYAYCGHPAIRHARFVKSYGYFHEQLNPGDIELEMGARYTGNPDGPNIWRPATLDQWGAWHHIGTDKTWKA